MVSEVAQTQLVIIFLASLVVYMSDRLEEREGVFSSNVFGVFLILIFLAAFLVACYFIAVDIFGYEKLSDTVGSTDSKAFFSRFSSMLSGERFSKPSAISGRNTALLTGITDEEEDDDEENPTHPSQLSLPAKGEPPNTEGEIEIKMDDDDVSISDVVALQQSEVDEAQLRST